MTIEYSNSISWQILDNVVYIIDELTNIVYKLTDVAKEIWQCVNRFNSLNEISDYLFKLYKVPKEVLNDDINELIENLISVKLLKKGE